MNDQPILVGISSCLTGLEVRFDGGHKRESFLTGTVSRFVDFVTVCAELEVGMGVPREAVRLIRRPDGVHMEGNRTGRDWTEDMERFCRRRVEELRALGLCGFILKKGSPTCGMERVRLYSPEGMPEKNGVGLFARALMEGIPDLPLEEEGRLCDPPLRENFFERVFAFRRLQRLFVPGWSRGDLVRFHTSEKMLLLAHDERGYRTLGRLVARAANRPAESVEQEYRSVFMATLRRKSSRGRNANVLQHMLGHLREGLAPRFRQDVAQEITHYRAGLVPLVVPMTMLAHYARVLEVPYLLGQTYLEPHPKELMLRNHV
jgi:uncharacterized protein YbgA (DUF1722 family)/uncharacterized protein YbbK (DUF523 family)